jgi:hypothetical protein
MNTEHIWTEIRQFLYIAALVTLAWSAVIRLEQAVDQLVAETQANTAVTRQVEYLLSTQGYVAAPLDPGPGSGSSASGSRSVAPPVER